MQRFSNWRPNACAILVLCALLSACRGGAAGGSGFVPSESFAGQTSSHQSFQPAVVPHHLHFTPFAQSRNPIGTSAGQNVYALFNVVESSSQVLWVYGASNIKGTAAPLSQLGMKTGKDETFVYVDARGRVFEIEDLTTKTLMLVTYPKPAGANLLQVNTTVCINNLVVGTIQETTAMGGQVTTLVKPAQGTPRCPKVLHGAVAFNNAANVDNASPAPSKKNVAFYSCMMGGQLFSSAAEKFYQATQLASGTTASILRADGDIHKGQAATFNALCSNQSSIALSPPQPAPKCPGPACVYKAPPVPLTAALAVCPAATVTLITFNAPGQKCTATLSGNPGASFTAKSSNTSVVTVSPASGTLDSAGKVTLTFIAGSLGGTATVTASSGSTNLTFDVTNAWTTSATTGIASLIIQLQLSTLPLGQQMTFGVVARAADGTTISGNYDHPIAVTTTNLTISQPSLATSAQAVQSTVSWPIGFNGSANGTITVTADGKTATATVVPGTGFAFYNVGNNANTDVNGFRMVLGPDNKIYYGTEGPATCSGSVCSPTDGAIGQFDPMTGKSTEIELHSPTTSVYFSSDGALWVGGGTSHKLFRFAPGTFSGTPTAIAISGPSGGGKWAIRDMTQDATSNLWFTDGPGGRVLKIPLSGPYNGTYVSGYTLPQSFGATPNVSPYGNGIVYASPSGYGKPGLFVTDFNNGVVDDLDAMNPSNGGFLIQFAGPQQTSAGTKHTVQPRFIATFGDGQIIYTGFGKNLLMSSASTPPIGFVDRIDPTISPVPQPPYSVTSPSGTQPDSIAVSGNNAYYADLYGALGYVNTSTSLVRVFILTPLATSSAAQPGRTPDGVVAMPDGTAWFTCYGSTATYQQKQLCLGHTFFTPTWSLWPGPSFTIAGTGATNAEAVGIMEAPTANSGPFTASSDNSSVCFVTRVIDHNFFVEGLATGTCTVTVTDASGKNPQNVQVTVVPAQSSSHPTPFSRRVHRF